MRGENTPHNCTCLVCGATFHRFASHIARGGGKYCSRACMGAAKKEMTGPSSPIWKGGRTISRGYVMLLMPDHPAANPKGYVAEHRLIAEQALGRLLLPGEVVHHDKGKVNLPENLHVLKSQAEHAALHQSLASAARWARNHDACIHCGTTAIPHKGDGLCDRCYERSHRYASD